MSKETFDLSVKTLNVSTSHEQPNELCRCRRCLQVALTYNAEAWLSQDDGYEIDICHQCVVEYLGHDDDYSPGGLKGKILDLSPERSYGPNIDYKYLLSVEELGTVEVLLPKQGNFVKGQEIVVTEVYENLYGRFVVSFKAA